SRARANLCQKAIKADRLYHLCLDFYPLAGFLVDPQGPRHAKEHPRFASSRDVTRLRSRLKFIDIALIELLFLNEPKTKRLSHVSHQSLVLGLTFLVLRNAAQPFLNRFVLAFVDLFPQFRVFGFLLLLGERPVIRGDRLVVGRTFNEENLVGLGGFWAILLGYDVVLDKRVLPRLSEIGLSGLDRPPDYFRDVDGVRLNGARRRDADEKY